MLKDSANVFSVAAAPIFIIEIFKSFSVAGRAAIIRSDNSKSGLSESLRERIEILDRLSIRTAVYQGYGRVGLPLLLPAQGLEKQTFYLRAVEALYLKRLGWTEPGWIYIFRHRAGELLGLLCTEIVEIDILRSGGLFFYKKEFFGILVHIQMVDNSSRGDQFFRLRVGRGHSPEPVAAADVSGKEYSCLFAPDGLAYVPLSRSDPFNIACLDVYKSKLLEPLTILGLRENRPVVG